MSTEKAKQNLLTGEKTPGALTNEVELALAATGNDPEKALNKMYSQKERLARIAHPGSGGLGALQKLLLQNQYKVQNLEKVTGNVLNDIIPRLGLTEEQKGTKGDIEKALAGRMPGYMNSYGEYVEKVRDIAAQELHKGTDPNEAYTRAKKGALAWLNDTSSPDSAGYRSVKFQKDWETQLLSGQKDARGNPMPSAFAKANSWATKQGISTKELQQFPLIKQYISGGVDRGSSRSAIAPSSSSRNIPLFNKPVVEENIIP